MFRGAQDFGKSVSKLARPQNVVYPGLLAAIVGYTSSESLATGIACYLYIFLLYSLAAGYNNLTDLHTDGLNKRADNPLLGKSINRRALYLFFVTNLMLLTFVQFFIRQPHSLSICLIYLMLFLSYSHRRINIKSKGYFSAALLCICYGSLPLLLGIVQGGRVAASIVYICVFQAILLLPIVLAKDYKDLIGDRLTNKKTPLVKYGAKAVTKVAIVSALFASIIFLVIDKQTPLYLQLLSALVYMALITWLHRNKGSVSQYLRLLLTVDMLAISLQAVF